MHLLGSKKPKPIYMFSTYIWLSLLRTMRKSPPRWPRSYWRKTGLICKPLEYTLKHWLAVSLYMNRDPCPIFPIDFFEILKNNKHFYINIWHIFQILWRAPSAYPSNAVPKWCFSQSSELSDSYKSNEFLSDYGNNYRWGVGTIFCNKKSLVSKLLLFHYIIISPMILTALVAQCQCDFLHCSVFVTNVVQALWMAKDTESIRQRSAEFVWVLLMLPDLKIPEYVYIYITFNYFIYWHACRY